MTLLAADIGQALTWAAGVIAVLAAAAFGVGFFFKTSWRSTNEFLDTSLQQERREREEMERRHIREMAESERRCDDKLALQAKELAILHGRVEAMTGEFANNVAELVMSKIGDRGGH